MLRKILKSLLSEKSSHRRHYSSSDFKKGNYGNRHRHYSSSDFKKRKYGYQHPSQYGHHHYKRKHRSSGFFSSYSS